MLSTLLGPPAVVAAGLDVLPQAASRSIAASGTATRRATRLWMRRFMCRPPPFCSHELYTGLYTKPNGACRAVSLRVLAASDRAGVLHAPLALFLGSGALIGTTLIHLDPNRAGNGQGGGHHQADQGLVASGIDRGVWTRQGGGFEEADDHRAGPAGGNGGQHAGAGQASKQRLSQRKAGQQMAAEDRERAKSEHEQEQKHDPLHQPDPIEQSGLLVEGHCYMLVPARSGGNGFGLAAAQGRGRGAQPQDRAGEGTRENRAGLYEAGKLGRARMAAGSLVAPISERTRFSSISCRMNAAARCTGRVCSCG